MDKYNKVIGRLGEEYAAKFLESREYKILYMNYNCRFGEIDIVGLDDKCLVFIEVKTRTTSRYGAPENAVNYWKRKHLQLSARMYIEQFRMREYFARFDVIEVFADYTDNKFSVKNINIIKNAF